MLRAFYPECVVLIAAGIILVGRLLAPRRSRDWPAYVSLAGLAIALMFAVDIWRKGATVTSQMLTVDALAVFFKMVVVVLSGLVVLASSKPCRDDPDCAEYNIMTLVAVFGAMMMASSISLLTLFVSLELATLPCFVLVALGRRDQKSSEGALKYFLLALFATALLLYGLSLVYGSTGTADLMELARRVPVGSFRPILLLGGLFVVLGLGFKLALVPFQFWAPDAYEGASGLVAAFLSVVPKAAALVAIVRVFLVALAPFSATWAAVFTVLAVLSMTVGNVMALTQDNVKRMLAYSSIANAGYILVGVAIASQLSLSGMLMYFTVYVVANVGAFSVVFACENHSKGCLLSDFAGLRHRAPLLALAMTVFLLSLVGIPPLAGFVGKIHLFGAAVERNVVWLAVVGVLNSVLSLGYYLRIVREMYIGETQSEEPRVSVSSPMAAALLVEVLAIVLIGLYPGLLIRVTDSAAARLFVGLP